ncbi:histidine phosphatase family protein [Proteiniclasticum sp.]|uniref:histidine phosphatase family protein n=1 Tax=Proteiniclasticum sp. TaxID=2053595 RepID=UPI0028980E35|nr:histidine phosphatase family protein [Proteiniclasticum sp.]
MTSLYFVRHAEPEHNFEEDRNRPLTDGGREDTLRVTDFFRTIQIDAVYASPYRRSHDTVKGCAESKGLDVNLDERLRETERPSGK